MCGCKGGALNARVIKEGRKEGRKEGGREGGREEGKEGRKEGRQAGRQAGRKEGRELAARSQHGEFVPSSVSSWSVRDPGLSSSSRLLLCSLCLQISALVRGLWRAIQLGGEGFASEFCESR